MLQFFFFLWCVTLYQLSHHLDRFHANAGIALNKKQNLFYQQYAAKPFLKFICLALWILKNPQGHKAKFNWQSFDP